MAVQKLYYWQALRSDGEFCAGERIGTSRNEIYQYLLELGYQPLRLKTGQYLTPRYWRGPQLSAIIRQLATLLQAGLPLLDALDLLGRQHEKAGCAACCRKSASRSHRGARYRKYWPIIPPPFR